MGRDWHLLSTQDWKVYKRFILRPWKIPPWTENQQGILRTLEIPIVQAAGPAASSQADVCTARSDLQGEHQNAVTGYCSTSTHGMLPVTAAHAHMGCSWFPQHMSTQYAAEMVKRGRDTALWRMPSVCVKSLVQSGYWREGSQILLRHPGLFVCLVCGAGDWSADSNSLGKYSVTASSQQTLH